MAINKAQSAPWVKVVVILVALSFVLMVGFSSVMSIIGTGKSGQTNSSPTTSQVDTIGAQYKASITANEQALKSDPKNNGLLVQQGNAYFDWAKNASTAVQTDPQAQAQVTPLWIAAADYYGQALAVKYDPNVATDRSVALFYSGKTADAIALANDVVKKDAKFATAWFNLGIFYEGAGDNVSALKAFNTFLSMKGTDQNSVTYAQGRVQQLQQAKASGTTTP